MDELLIRIEDVLNGKYRFVEGQPVRRSYVDMEIENMRYEDVQDYIQLQDMFQARCETVCGLLKPLNYSYRYLSEFEISDNEVWGEGDEYWSYGGHEHHSAKFPLSFLWNDDKEIKRYVEDELKKRRDAEEAERLRIQKLQEDAQEKRDREEYERLKKKFGGV